MYQVREHWVVIRGAVVVVLGVALALVGLASGKDLAFVAGVFIALVGGYLTDLESIGAGPFGVRAARRLVRQVAEAIHAEPGLRGLSAQRIATEVRLYEAILRLQTARYDNPRLKMPRDLEAKVGRFWRRPEDMPYEPQLDAISEEIDAFLGGLAKAPPV